MVQNTLEGRSTTMKAQKQSFHLFVSADHIPKILLCYTVQ